MATSQLNANGFSLLSAPSKGLNIKDMTQFTAREIAMSGYGTVKQTDVGKAPAEAYEIAQTLRSFHAMEMQKDAAYSTFALFRDAVAHEAENAPRVLQSAGGSSYTGFYKDLIDGENAISANILTSSNGSPEAQLRFDTVDWSDFNSRQDYFNRIYSMSAQTGLREHLGRNLTEIGTGEQELMILLHTANSDAYAAYIKQFEEQIQKNFTDELASLQNAVKDLGFNGNMHKIGELEKFADTLGGTDKAKVQQLIAAMNGKINKVDRYVLARINSGEIDIQKILSTKEFNGVKLDEQSLAAFKALSVYANSDAIATQYSVKILKNIGFDSKFKSLDLSKLSNVRALCGEFETALGQAGITGDGGKVLAKMSMKQLRQIDLSKIANKDLAEALKHYISLRDHQETLMQAKSLMQNFKMRMVNLTRRILGDSDLSQGIGKLQSIKHSAKFAWKIAQKTFHIKMKFAGFVKRIGKNVKMALLRTTMGQKYTAFVQRMLQSNNFIGKFLRTKQTVSRAVRGTVKKVVSAPQKMAAAVKKKAAEKAEEHMSRNAARRLERKLLRKAGRRAGTAARRAAHLAVSGVGTTGAGAAGAGAAGGTAAAGGAGAGGAGAGAGGAAAGGGAGVVLIWIIVIILIISAVTTVLGMFFNVIGEAVGELDNKLTAVVEWFKDWWPWSASEREKENVLNYTVGCLLIEESEQQDISKQLESLHYYHGVVPSATNDAKNVTFTSTEMTINDASISDTPAHYIYVNENNEPISEYSTVKLVVSMAHAFTYELHSDSDLKNFTRYATGLWEYLNKTSLTVKIELCSGEGTFSYRCNTKENDSGLYKAIKDGKLHIVHVGDRKEIYGAADISTFMYSKQELHKHTEKGCLQQIFSAKNKTFTNIRDDVNEGSFQYNEGWTKLTEASSDFYDMWSYTGDDAQTKYPYMYRTAYFTYNGVTYPYTYSINPNINERCANEHQWKKKNGSQFSGWIEYCSDISTCNNAREVTYFKEKKYTYTTEYDSNGTKFIWTGTGKIPKPHWSDTSKPYHTEYIYYHCNGHDETVYCSPESNSITIYTGYKTSTKTVGNKTITTYTGTGKQTITCLMSSNCCESCIRVDGYEVSTIDDNPNTQPGRKTTYYYCYGHTNHGDFDSSSPYYNTCKHKVKKQVTQIRFNPETGEREPVLVTRTVIENNFTEQKGYIDQGHSVRHEQTINHTGYVCRGHVKCTGDHWYCQGHELTYCTGHPVFTLTRKTIENEDAIYSDNWTYTIPQSFLWIKWDKVLTPKKPAPDGQDTMALSSWRGWDDDAKEMMSMLYSSDWYTRYDFGSEWFVGGQISKGEKQAILKQYDILTRTDLTTYQLVSLHKAIDAVGKINTYPGDKAVAGDYDETNRFGEYVGKDKVVFDSNGHQQAFHGLSAEYFADWIYLSTHGKHNSALSSLSRSTIKTKVTSSTKPGSLIVNKGDFNGCSAVLLKATSSTIRCITMSSNGWCSIMTFVNDGQWYTADSLNT